MLRDSDSDLFFSDARVRKVKLQHDDNTSERICLGEIVVYDESGADRALDKPATQSSDYDNSNSYPASNAVDGDTATFSHTENETGQYSTVFIHFDAPKTQ